MDDRTELRLAALKLAIEAHKDISIDDSVNQTAQEFFDFLAAQGDYAELYKDIGEAPRTDPAAA